MSESHVMEEPLERLRLNATKCRELADTALTPNGRQVLSGLAAQYEERAASLERSERQRRPQSPFRWSLP